MSRFNFTEGEDGPFLNMSIGDQHMCLDWESTTLFTHGSSRHVDHIFIQFPEEVEQEDDDRIRRIGAFIWRQALPDWDDLAEELTKLDFPHIHMPAPSLTDLATYESTGLTPPKAPESLFKSNIIEEDDDERIAHEAVSHIDAEWDFYDKEWH